MLIARVFPRRTKATPIDDLAFVGYPPLMPVECERVHVSVAFTWDIPFAEKLAGAWTHIAPTEIGGPALGTVGGDFEPGMYIKGGYVMTSRGCPNRCWFCKVWQRDGDVRELPIRDGWNVLDDNLLACSDGHVRAVFAMLAGQSHPVEFTGGLEAARLKYWHVAALRELHPKQMFFAYDTPNDLEPLRDAGRMLLAAGFTEASHALRCYVLCGWPKDSEDAAERRMQESLEAGFTPMAMLFRDKQGRKSPEWRTFQRRWARPAIIHAKVMA